jgi:serine/threonine protein kinase
MFMAPEQFAGRAADERSDQFAFAVAVYWALYQRHPYLAASARPPSLAELVAALNRAALNVPSSSTVPAALFNVLRTGLAVDPARRFESMQQLLDELARVLRDGGDDRARVSARRRTLIACASSLGVTLAVLAWALARAPGAGPAEVSEAEGARPHGRESIREYSRALTPTTGEPSPVVQPAALSSKVTLEQTTESSAANASAKKAAHTKAQRIQSARAGGPSAATVRKTSVSSGLKQYNNALKDPF